MTLVPKHDHSDGENPIEPRKEPKFDPTIVLHRRQQAQGLQPSFWYDNYPRKNRNLGLLSLILFLLHEWRASLS